MEDVRTACRDIKEKSEPGLIIIDNLLSLKGMENDVNEFKIKQLARELNCPVIITSQLNRKLERRPNKRPIISDLKGNFPLEDEADMIWLLYRDEYYNPDSPDKGIARLFVSKNRGGETGFCSLLCNLQYASFDSI